MLQSHLLEQALAAANNVLTAIQNNSQPDLNSWVKWTQALLRDVLYTPELRTTGQSLENLLRKAANQILVPIPGAEQTLQEWISLASSVHAPDQPIAFQPPFDLTTPHYYQ